jgi:uncharacterized protein YabE (DUF348 family)
MVASVLFCAQTVAPADSHVVQLTLDGKKQTVPTRAKSVQEFLDRAEVTLHEGDIVEPAKDTPIEDNDFRVNVYRARPVTIVDGDNRVQALSAATTPRSVAAQAGVQVYPEDNLDQQVSNDLLKDQILGEKIVISRATPTNLNLYGTPVTVRTHAKTVRDLLKEKNITLGTGDSVQPVPDTPITPNIQVFVTRVGTQIATVEEPIPMEVETVEDPGLSFGTTAVRQVGAAGKKLVTYQLELQNGKEVARKIIQEVRVTEPVKQINARGKAVSIPEDKSQIMAAAGISPGDYPYVNYIISRESGWCPTKWQGSPGACPPYYQDLHPISSGYGYGLCQSTPAQKMATAGADWQTNAITQLRWCSGYAHSRYGSWGAAYNHWLSSHNW